MKDYTNPSKLFFVNVFLLSSFFTVAQLSTVSLPPKRAHHALVYDNDKKRVLLFGGSTPVDNGNSGIFFNDAWAFADGKWKYLGDAGDKRSGFRLAFDSKRKKIFSFGGYTGDRSCCSDLRVWEDKDPVATGWKKIADIPGLVTAELGLVYDSHRDRLVSFGGSPAPRQVNSDTWEWDGNEWKKFQGTSPDGRQAFAMEYDEKRKKTILFGGLGTSGPSSMFGDTWEFDGNEWKKLTGEGPGPRASAGFAYDSDKGIFILFGGITQNGFVNDTWSFDGAAWKKLADDGPPKRAMGYLVYDKERKKVLMFGGRLGWPNDANDTWEWDGAKCTEIKF